MSTKRRVGWLAVATLGALGALALVPLNTTEAEKLVAASLTRTALSKLPLPEPPVQTPEGFKRPPVTLKVQAPEQFAKEIHSAAAANRGFRATPDASPRLLTMTYKRNDSELALAATYRDEHGKVKEWKGTRRFATKFAAFPPIFAIIMALVTRRVLLSILSGAFVGALLVYIGAPGGGGIGYFLASPFVAIWQTGVHYLWGQLTDPFNLFVLGFTFALTGMVGISGRAGGNIGIVDVVAKVATDGRRTRLATALMGLAIFFEDYANAIVVGQTARPLTDAMRVSREKLAYLVDSTSAPVAGIALISTWIGYEVGLFQSVADGLGIDQRGYQMFIDAVPYRFYCFFGLIFLFASTLLRRDFGPMLKAERRAFHLGQLWGPTAKPLSNSASHRTDPIEGAKPRWWITGLPVIVMLLGVIGGMVWSGGSTLSEKNVAFVWSAEHLRLCFSYGDNGKVLLYAALVGTVVALLLARTQRVPKDAPDPARRGKALLNFREISMSWLWGGWASVPALAILVTAKMLQAATDDLSTSAYLIAVLGQGVPAGLLPLATFGVAAAVAFATGTSWGTMGILIPAMGPLAYHLGGAGLMLIVLASILDGAIFGDHCSPISDTTIMSSLSSQCDHVDHVRTQAPYAITAMLVAAAVGYLGLNVGINTTMALLIGSVIIVVILFLIGRDPEAPWPEAEQPKSTSDG